MNILEIIGGITIIVIIGFFVYFVIGFIRYFRGGKY